MKYLRITCVFILLACLIAVGQVNQIWYKKGKVLYAVPVAGIDSVTYGQFLSADTFFIVIDRASWRIVYDTVDVHVPGMVYHDTIHTTHTIHLNPGRRIGVFSVAKNKQVSFSQGNLQYVQNQNVWKFADQQYEMIGARNVKDGKLANKIDLFGWSGDNTTAPFGVSTSSNNADYVGEFVDWGVNEINGDAPNTWRTLSKDEWEYLINERPNAQQLRTKGSVNGNGGVILLPDDWVCPTECSVIMVSDEMNLLPDVNAYSLEEWRRMEDAGAVLLTAAGMRRNKDVSIVQHENIFGGYWASTIKSAQNSYCYNFHIQTCEYVDYSCWIYGRSVRLVHDTILPPPAPCETFEVNGIEFNMMCVEGGTFMMGAMEGDAQANANEKPAHQVTLSDYYMSDVQVSQALWEAVMGTTIDDEVERHGGEKNIGKGADYPMYAIDWFQANEFAEKLSKLTGLRFSLPTEAEWEYAARGGQKSRGYKFAGSDNLDEVAWWNDAKGLIHPSGQLKPNELGIYDMCGNICEWTLDGYSNYTSEAQTNPLMPRVGNVVQRSMSSHNSWTEADHRVTFRYNKDPYHAKTRVGIRLVLHDTVQVVHEYVDLGLSVKWATFNLGASVPEDYGNYFAWGEVEPKTEYSWENYKWCDGTVSNMTKYNDKDGLTSLNLDDDAAHVNWGDKWRMPTDEEFTELREKCKWEWTTQNGVNGYKVIGVNGNSIFLPVSGFYYDNGLVYVNDHGDYWSSTKNVQSGACHVYVDLDKVLKSSSHRYYGFPIRAVYDDIPDPCQVVKVNDTLSINLMCVEGGTFMMGAMEGDTLARNAEKPAHLVTLNYDYSIMQTEVTQEMWEAIMGEDIYDLIAESPYPDSKPISTKGNFPVGYVRLKQCLEFIDSLNARTGLHFRMPTEAEWEYAARGGHRSKGFLYSGSDDMSDVAHINYGIVAKLRPNELGIYDMSGNIAEMTLDYLVDHETGYPSAKAQVNPRRISTSGNRAVRGLKRFSSYVNLRISHRSAYTPSWCGPGMGFRLVLPEERDFRTIYVNGVFFDMAFVEGGTFMMGDDSSDNASPAHQVTLSDYYIGQTEVTQALWKAVMGTNPSKFSGNNLPVECVSWEDCQVFVQKLSEMTGLHFRLPTEAEWEFAARGGVKSRGYAYAGSDDVDSVAWYGVNSGQKTHSIAGKKPNELGIYDMSGNVWEWCQDWHEPYTAEPQVNPQGASEGEKRVLRGCAYDSIKSSCYVLCRVGRFPNHISNFAGLRIVLDISNQNE